MSPRRWGEALLDADTERIRGTEALGLDEHLMWRRGRFRTKAWATSIVDVGRGQLLDIVAGRTAQASTRWLRGRPRSWLRGVRWAVLDLSGPYRAAFDAAAPHASQVADPFHVVRLANDALDEVRRRVQNQTLGHRGHKHDPLYRARKLPPWAPMRCQRRRGLRCAGVMRCWSTSRSSLVARRCAASVPVVAPLGEPEGSGEARALFLSREVFHALFDH